jgi:hypothetical protein
MRIARTCDDRVDELKTQHANVIVVKENIIAKLEKEKAALNAQVALLHAQVTSKLTGIHAAIATLQTLEIHPVRPDRRQFAEWHNGPLPACLAFDRTWCTAACGTNWKVEIDAATGMRAHVTHERDDGWLTLRSAAALQRCPLTPGAGVPQQDQSPSYRIVIEAHDTRDSCWIGFLPSHRARTSGGGGAAVTPLVGHPIWKYGGWSIEVDASEAGDVDDAPGSGWTVLQPSHDAAGDSAGDTSAYATTSKVPPVPEGSAVEFAVDYAAGTCRVAFYTPAAVASGFVKAPYAKMELRFVATEADQGCEIPMRPIPTVADSGVELYPAVTAGFAGAVWRLAPGGIRSTPMREMSHKADSSMTCLDAALRGTAPAQCTRSDL